MSTTTPIYLATDFYKLSHREQYPEGTTVVYSTLTPRSNKYAPWSNEIVVFGLQYFIKEYLIERFNKEFFQVPLEEVVTTYEISSNTHLVKKKFIQNTLFNFIT